jgi:hypothetical protein
MGFFVEMKFVPFVPFVDKKPWTKIFMELKIEEGWEKFPSFLLAN